MQVTSTPVPTVDAISEENGGVPEGDLWSLPSVEETAVTTPDTINIVELASLRETVSIEVCKLDCASYTLLCTVNNPELIADLIDLLDTDLPLNPHTCCPAAYQLRFILVEGRRYDFGYACQLATPAFLRGNQAFLQDRDAVDPDAFNALMPPLIDLSCPASVSMHGNRLLAIIGSREEKDLKPDV